MTNLKDNIVKSNFLYSGLEGVRGHQEFAKNMTVSKTHKAIAMAAWDTHKITEWINSASMAPCIDDGVVAVVMGVFTSNYITWEGVMGDDVRKADENDCGSYVGEPICFVRNTNEQIGQAVCVLDEGPKTLGSEHGLNPCRKEKSVDKI